MPLFTLPYIVRVPDPVVGCSWSRYRLTSAPLLVTAYQIQRTRQPSLIALDHIPAPARHKNNRQLLTGSLFPNTIISLFQILFSIFQSPEPVDFTWFRRFPEK
jgi:hypothetical protein